MIRIEGNNTILNEVCPEYFNYIISWRNDIVNNRYLNQPFQLTLELQKQWYERYIQDTTQGLFVAVDKNRNKPFATIGWTNYDKNSRSCIAGRLLVGDKKYRGSDLWKEAVDLFNNYLYCDVGIDIMYAHIVKDNIASIKWHLKWGWEKNNGVVVYPDELEVNNMQQEEFIRSKESYNMWRKINEF